MEAGFGYIEELDLGLSGGSRGGGTLSNILLAAASCLYHLVDGTITPLQKVMSKVKGNIIDTLCLLKGDEVSVPPLLRKEAMRCGHTGYI